MVDQEEHSVLEQIVSGVKSGLMYPVEVGYIVYDFLTIWIRDAEILRPIKKKLPFLACRRYYSFGGEPTCAPAQKYHHDNLFFCKHYDKKTKECTKYKDK
ncbi:hypothetical protein KY331_01790 [Candidatus Woesearchaeota archaeon]|nr:hypothetical protein [Candidatus Woesearchaeota archaeon]